MSVLNRSPLEILAEMRAWEPHDPLKFQNAAEDDVTDIKAFADRLEEAINDQKQEWLRDMNALWERFSAYRKAVESDQKTQPRKMLLNLQRYFESILACQHREQCGGIVQIPSCSGFGILDDIRGTLASPQKNAERFETLGEAVLASGEATAEAPGLLGMSQAQLVRFCKWLFATSERSAK